MVCIIFRTTWYIDCSSCAGFVVASGLNAEKATEPYGVPSLYVYIIRRLNHINFALLCKQSRRWCAHILCLYRCPPVISKSNLTFTSKITMRYIITIYDKLFTSDKGGGIWFSPCLFVCLSVCEQDYLKTHALIWMKCCVSTAVGTWTNWLIRIIVRRNGINTSLQRVIWRSYDQISAMRGLGGLGPRPVASSLYQT